MRRVVTLLIMCTLLVAGCGASDHAGHSEATKRTGVTRTYFISADMVEWDYAPDGHNLVTGKPFGEAENVFVRRGADRIGSRYLKCLYRGYADESFTEPQAHPAEDAYLGYLGPVIRAEVGDTIKVVFRNTCPFPTSIHTHGVRYDKANEGAAYGGGTAAPGDAVPTGKTTTYTWHADKRSGPGHMDGSTAAWMYHSHVNEISDVYAGLTGFLVVTEQGEADEDARPKDVDREVFSLYEVDDENNSPLLARNIRRFARGGPVDVEDEGFVESNLMHAINGYVYGNGPVPQLEAGEKVRWYAMGMGTEVDMHTPHWHGNTVTINGMRTDVGSLLPASMFTADMTPDAVGKWLFHCHVGDHIAAGMQSFYEVVAPPG